MCVKCITDSTHTTAVARYLIEKQAGWLRMLDTIGDDLDDEDYAKLKPMADEMCYEGNEWMDKINSWDETFRNIAKKHTPPKKKPHA